MTAILQPNLGYCCINTTLKEEHGITTNRGLTKKTLESKGLDYVSELVLENTSDLLSILKWNVEHNIKVFRLSSDIFPWNTTYQISDLKHYKLIVRDLELAGQYIRENDIRVSIHPDHFVKLASEDSNTVKNSILELNHHSTVLELMHLPANHKYCINIHIGHGTKDIDGVIKRFITSFNRLASHTKQRLVLENDDKPGMFSVKQLYYTTYANLHIPITFDYFHHELHSDGLTEVSAYNLAYSTWGGEIPLFHYSESKALNEGVNVNRTAHSDYIFKKINTHGLSVDIDVEAKAKEKAVLRYMKKYHENNEELYG